MAEPLENVHILIAEDNPTNQIVVAKIVEKLGGSFDLAADGVEAIQLFDPKKHDLALLDIEMPRKSGLEVIRHIRENSQTPENFPIVALTAFVLSEHRAKILDAGADAILAKPIVDIHAFGQELATVLGRDGGAQNVQNGLVRLEENMGKDVMPELLASLTKDLKKQKARLEEGADGDLKSVAHAVKSLAGLVEDEALEKLAADIEKAPGEDDADARQALRKGIENLLTQIKKFAKD